MIAPSRGIAASGYLYLRVSLIRRFVARFSKAGTDCNRFTFFWRTCLRLRNGMTPAAKCKRLATMLRAKAELERDPEIRAEWKCIARGYLILADQIERNGSKEIRYRPFARDIDEEVT